MFPQMAGARSRGNHLLLPNQGPVHVRQKVWSLKPPVPEELGVEGRDDYTFTALGLTCGDAGEEVGEVLRMPPSPV
jgi:hypothetical protein